MALVAVAVAVVANVVPAIAAAVEIVTASPTGAAWTALAEMTMTSPLAPTRDAAFGEEFTQPFHGSAHPFLRGVVGRAERGADFAEGFVFEVTEQHGRAVGVVERGDGFVQQRFDLRPVAGSGIHGIHLGGDLFAQLPAGFAPHDVDGGAAGDCVEPGSHDRVGLQRGGVP